MAEQSNSLQKTQDTKTITDHFGLPASANINSLPGVISVLSMVENMGYDTDILGRNYNFEEFGKDEFPRGKDYTVMIRNPKEKEILIECTHAQRTEAIFCALLKFAQDGLKKIEYTTDTPGETPDPNNPENSEENAGS